MKKLLLSVAILVFATLVLCLDSSEDLKNMTSDEVASVQVKL